VFSFYCKAQQHSFNEEIKFTQYLTDNSEYKDALLALSQIKLSELNLAQQDSLLYFLGWAHYNLKQVDSSATYFSRVSQGSGFYYKSKFYEVFDNCYALKFIQADSVLNSIKMETSSSLIQLKTYDKISIALLNKDISTFRTLMKSNQLDFYALSDEAKSLDNYARKMEKIKHKSAFIAGSLSAVIPGLGKLYAGMPGQALASFLTVATLGAVAAENYIKAGPTSGRFIVYAGIFSMFYIGNIWGSAISVKVKREKQFNEIKHNILVDMHIPLRRTFE
jgi:hypothetical protein